MENKTIRVWDREVDSCSTCPLFHYDDYGCSVCNEIELKSYTKCSDGIDENCPFSKPLSKEDIESCVHTNTDDFHTIFRLREEYTNELCFQTYWIEENEWLDEEYIYWDIKHNTFKVTHKSKTLFYGFINNLPEFKLILKMLNIE